MQPYFFPYIGYFQLIKAVDVFVLYDNIEYTKKGWINRNRFLLNGSDALFSIPLRKASDYDNIDQRQLSDDFDRRKLLNRIRAAYRKAPCITNAMELFRRAIEYQETNLFQYIKHSITMLCDALEIGTTIVDSSTVQIDHSARGQDKVLAICDALQATTYINAIGGVDLYQHDAFNEREIELQFIEPACHPYQQFEQPFVNRLSILDVLMFNSVETVRDLIVNDFALVTRPVAKC